MAADLIDRVVRHYRRCEEVLRSVDVDGFLDWLGPEGAFEAADGRTMLVADTRTFWEWHFAKVLDVPRCDISVQNVARSAPDTIAVYFHEITHTVVRGFDGEPVERNADLHNRNWWRVDNERLTARGSAELLSRRTLGGVPLSDDVDPWGLAAWGRESASK